MKLFVRISALAELSAWLKKKLEAAKAEGKPRELVHARGCDPIELLPVLSRLREQLAQ
ncbi:hypothetical protein [Methylobacterium nigriterrae]|uniref:hypothetical protein n=1 Tax=Methylobacterium nigriterrae TaxID=3127512 RepID=UPI00301393F6